jgi:hypothetical protein
MKLAISVLCAVIALTLTAVGCGGSDSDLTKAEFLKRGDAICREINKQRDAAIRAYAAKIGRPQQPPSRLAQLGIVTEAALPPIEVEARKLEELGLPSEEEAKAQAIIDGLRSAVEKTRARPASVLGKARTGPFAEVSELAEEFGFQTCARYS